MIRRRKAVHTLKKVVRFGNLPLRMKILLVQFLLLGMNFDYPEAELRFVVEENKDKNVLFMQFMQGRFYIYPPGHGLDISQKCFLSANVGHTHIIAEKYSIHNNL